MWEVIFKIIQQNAGLTILGAITIIQFSPLKIDPWTWIAKCLRGVFYGDIEKKLDSIAKKVDAVEARIDEEKAANARNHILRFADELYDGRHHSQEFFLQTLDDIKAYDDYCEAHPNFKNGRTVNACEKIQQTYDSLWKNHKF